MYSDMKLLWPLQAEMLFRKICPDEDFLQPPQVEND